VRDRVEKAQRRWEEGCRDSSLLLADGLPAEEGRRLLAENTDGVSADLADFVSRSLAHHEAAAARTVRRTQAVIVALAGLALLATAGGLFAWRKEHAVRLALRDVAARSADYRTLLRQASDNDLATGIEIWTAYEAEAIKGRMLEGKGRMLTGIAGEPKFKESLAYWIRALRLSPDNRPAAAWLFTALADTLARQPLVPPPDIGYLTFCEHSETSGNGMRSLAVPVSDRRQLVAWDARTGEPLASPQVHERDVEAVAISPSGRFIATVERGSREVSVFDADRGLARHAVLLHDRIVHTILFGPDDQTLLSLGSDLAADEVLLAPGIVLLSPPGDREVAQRFSCWNLEDRGEATIRWTTEESEPETLVLVEERGVSALFSDDGEIVFVRTVAGEWHGRDLATGETRDHVLPSKPDVPLSRGPNGAVPVLDAGGTHPLNLLAVTGGTDVVEIVMHRESAVATIRATRHGCNFGACGSMRVPDRCIRLDVAPPPPTFSAEEWEAAEAPMAPAFRRIDERTVQLLDPATQAARGLPLRHPEPVPDDHLVASRDGRFVLSNGFDGRLCLWDAITGRLLCPPFVRGFVEEARFSKDGMRVLVRRYEPDDGGARDLVWQLEGLGAMLGLPAVTPVALDWAERVVGVRFSPSGELETVPAAEQRAVLDLPVPEELAGLGLAPLRTSK
jgi:hypothetical protein